jgi:hypothetical protein
MHNVSEAQNAKGNEGNLNLANIANKTTLPGPEQTRSSVVLGDCV